MADNFTRAAALVALLAGAGTLAWSVAAGPDLPLPVWAEIPAAHLLLLLLLALAVWRAGARDPGLARRLALCALALCGLVLASWVVTAMLETPASDSGIGRLLAGRPPWFVTLAVATLGGAIATWNPASRGFDVAAVLGTVAVAAFALLGLGHLYGASVLVSSPGSAAPTGLSTLLFFVLSLSLLAAHAGGPLLAYEGDGPGPVAKRRLLPAAVLTPVATGFLLLYAIDEQLSPTVAVTLAVFANVLVMLLLIDRAGNRAEAVAQDRQAQMEARAARVKKQGMRDALTGMLNRRGWDAEVQAAERRCRAESRNACVVVIDLDGLKQVNDAHGHKAGDAYIQRAAGALRRAARRGDALARVGGDEFAYLVVGCDEEDAQSVVARFQDSLRVSKIGASVGYAMRGGRSIGGAFDQADQAMYEQKRTRKLRRA